MDLVLVTRRGCHLCDDALALLQDLGTRPRIADIDTDGRLFDLYDWRVPVVMLDGRVIAEGLITRDQLAGALGLEKRREGAG
ncbi:MAG TPA: glutaredoxin family protein [Candidatus Dormibacteraeota bacterium]